MDSIQAQLDKLRADLEALKTALKEQQEREDRLLLSAIIPERPLVQPR